MALPPSAVLDYRRQSLEILAQQRLHALQTGLWCHAGLFNIAFAGADATTFTDTDGLAPALSGSAWRHGILSRCGRASGTTDGREHGTGLKVLRHLKQCLDPQGILNPGKLDLVTAPSLEPAVGP